MIPRQNIVEENSSAALKKGRARNSLWPMHLTLILFLVTSLGSLKNPSSDNPYLKLQRSTGDLIVVVRTPLFDPQGFFSAAGVNFKRKLATGEKSFYLVRPKPFKSISSSITALRARPNVITVSEDLIKYPSFVPNDFLFHRYPNDPISDNQWWLILTVGTPPDDAWKWTKGSDQVVVAVLDTGCKLNHLDLKNQIWVNIGEVAGNGVDDDGRGFIDDVNGYDFRDNDGNPDDNLAGSSGHGTNTAGMVGAQMNNDIGVASVAGGDNTADFRGVRLMIVRVGDDGPSVPGGQGIKTSDEIAGLNYAKTMGADVINMSFGGPTDDPVNGAEAQAVRQVYASGSGPLLVAAAGNTLSGDRVGKVDYPAGFPEVISVSATTLFDESTRTLLTAERVTTFSFANNDVEVAAPGTFIITTAITGNYTTEPTNGPEGYFIGTSAAAPVVSGFAGLIKSYFPTRPSFDIRAIIQNSVVNIPPPQGFTEEPNGKDIFTGYGRIQMAKAFTGQIVTETIPGDTNSDGVVDDTDVLPIIEKFGMRTSSSDPKSIRARDANQDNVIDELDLFLVGNNFGLTAQ